MAAAQISTDLITCFPSANGCKQDFPGLSLQTYSTNLLFLMHLPDISHWSHPNCRSQVTRDDGLWSSLHLPPSTFHDRIPKSRSPGAIHFPLLASGALWFGDLHRCFCRGELRCLSQNCQNHTVTVFFQSHATSIGDQNPLGTTEYWLLNSQLLSFG